MQRAVYGRDIPMSLVHVLCYIYIKGFYMRIINTKTGLSKIIEDNMFTKKELHEIYKFYTKHKHFRVLLREYI